MSLFPHPESPFQIELSFDMVIETLKRKAPTSVSTGRLLKEIERIPELISGITDTSQIFDHRSQIRELLEDYFHISLTNNEIKAVGIPYSNFFFNHSSRFKKILQEAGPNFTPAIRDLDDHQFYIMSCSLILDKFYNTKLDFSRPLFYDIPGPDGLIKHYRILYNADYLRIIPTGKALKLTNAEIMELQDNYSDLELWKEKIPPGSFKLRGFAIISLFDSTIENAVSQLKEQLLEVKPTSFKSNFTLFFRSIFQLPHINVGLSLYDNKTDSFYRNPLPKGIKSYLIKHNNCRPHNSLCRDSYLAVMNIKSYYAVSNISRYRENISSNNLLKGFQSQEIESFILAPIVKNGHLLGILEIVSKQPNDLNSVNANKLDIVMPMLTVALERLIFQYQNQVNAIIQENYTTIHPSVQWRFKKEAQQWINSINRNKKYQLKEIKLKKVYPLYGQVDIQGSTAIRINCLKKDLQNQLLFIQKLYNSLLSKIKSEAILEDFKVIQKFLQDLNHNIFPETEANIAYHLTNSTHPLLQALPNEEKSGIKKYFSNFNNIEGEFHRHRKKYDDTINLINKNLISIIDKGQEDAQRLFPHYYERFKTDGVDHSLYIGQSISPTSKFELQHLRDLRLWQLKKTCEMVISHRNLKPRLSYPLDVTSLILAYSTTIDLRFRMDEKRLDVDGSYNMKFEVIKKRIDKALIKNSTERITKKNRLTIVCSNKYELDEYLKYYDILKAQKLLKGKFEILEIEDLQDIIGLIALRVKIGS